MLDGNRTHDKIASEKIEGTPQYEGGHREGDSGVQQLISASNIEHPLYFESAIAANDVDDLGDNDNDGWKSVQERYQENTVK